MQEGLGTLLAKVYIHDAYHLIPAHPHDCQLLGMSWVNQLYVDLALPIGLGSAPFIFNQFAKASPWILHHRHGIRYQLHYLDDYLTTGAPNSRECHNNFSFISSSASSLKIPLAFLWGSPSTVHSFRGIKLDTISLLTKSLHTTTNVSLNIRQNSWPPPSCCCPFLHLLIDLDSKNSQCCFIHISRIARADLLWSSFAPWLELLLASLFLLACLTCQTFKCVLMLQELPHLEPILMAFGLPSNCLRALFIQNFILLS